MTLDLYKEHKHEYRTSLKPFLLNIAGAKYFTIDGEGAPGSEFFQTQVGALYTIAYAVKFESKFAGRDYKFTHLEGFYYVTPDPAVFGWKLLIRVPDFISGNHLTVAAHQALAKGKPDMVRQVKLARIRGGRCVQALHVGPYSTECETAAKMRAFAESQGLAMGTLHHEIYISDPHRVAPEKLRTILRYPVRKA
jgi:hypothetical protein